MLDLGISGRQEPPIKKKIQFTLIFRKNFKYKFPLTFSILTNLITAKYQVDMTCNTPINNKYQIQRLMVFFFLKAFPT